MIKIRRTAASVIGALLVLGACGVAAAQGTQHAPGTASREEPKQTQLDHDKATLKDQVQDAIKVASSNVGVLNKMQSTDSEADKKRDKDMEKKISDLRDELKKDLDKIDKATASDWSSVRSSVESNLKTMDTELKTAANVTHVPPTKGAASKQPRTK